MSNTESLSNPQADIFRKMEQELFPFLKERGFRQIQHPILVSQIIDFNRVVQNVVHCLEFDFDRKGRPMFQVMIAKGPMNGITLKLPQEAIKYWGNQGFRPGQELCVRDCPLDKRGVLRSRLKRNLLGFLDSRFDLRNWFGMSNPIGLNRQKAAKEPIRLFIERFSECEAWWQHGALGQYIAPIDKAAETHLKKIEKRIGGNFYIER